AEMPIRYDFHTPRLLRSRVSIGPGRLPAGRGISPMEMHQVRYFLALGELLNFTRAAERCHVSQPALTRAIQTLEDELGGPLLHRERHNTHLTELGRMMRPYLQDVLEQSRKAKERARAFASLGAAPLALGVMCTIGPT